MPASVSECVSGDRRRLLAQALGRIAGYGAPDGHDGARKTLDGLLTPWLANKLEAREPTEVLRLLTSNSQTPYLIWNNATRAELTDYLEKQRDASLQVRGFT